MKKFLEELAKYGSFADNTPTTSKTPEKLEAIRKRFQSLVGRRALYRCGSEKSLRVVTIVEATPYYVRMSYNYYGRDYQGVQHVCCQYGLLISGDDRIDIR